MQIAEERIRRIIREFLELDEGVFGGVGTSTTSTTMTASEKAATRRQSALASQQAAAAAKRGLTPTVAGVRSDLRDKGTDELRKEIEGFKTSMIKDDPKSDDRAVAATLKIAADRKIPADELNRIVQRNRSLGAALTSMKGGAELEKAAEEELRSKDKEPSKDATLAWQAVGDIARKQGLT
jgi:hypothetical protein